MRFLDVTLDTYQDTSGYMYLGLFKQNSKDEWCAWKRFARDGRNFRVLEHTTGYFYQEGFLPSHRPRWAKKMRRKKRLTTPTTPTSSRQPRRRRETRELRHLLRLLRSKAPKAAAKAAKAAAMAPKESPRRASTRGRK